ncbi:MAG: iron-containing alcohol dehydrogenase [Gammaproteobacteria bacterium]
MNLAPFSTARLPHIEFGSGRLALVPELAARHGRRLLLVTGRRSIDAAPQWQPFLESLQAGGLSWQRLQVAGEPSPQLVDEAVAGLRDEGIEVVVGIGGGSVLDAGKAVAGLLGDGHSVVDYLEGVGPELVYQGPPLPYIAVPTTAGTGSEATKNAVLSRIGREGFKKSFRDEQLVPDYAVVDPDLLATCPPSLIAANGMDALTQLIESYVSLRANPLTEALAWSGLEAARDGLLPWYEGGGSETRSRMAYAALVSGITLAQTGLGSVHGLASPLGAFFPIPHGMVCGTLVAAATRLNIEALRRREPDHPALAKYAAVGALLTGNHFDYPEDGQDALVERLDQWTRRMSLERLSSYGVTAADIPRIVTNSRGSSMKTNPIVLTDEEIAALLAERL